MYGFTSPNFNAVHALSAHKSWYNYIAGGWQCCRVFARYDPFTYSKRSCIYQPPSCTRTQLHNEPSYGFLLSADPRRCGVKLPAEERMKLVWRTAIVCCVLILITTVWMVYTTFYVVSQPDVHVCLHITNVLLQSYYHCKCNAWTAASYCYTYRKCFWEVGEGRGQNN